MTDIATTDAVTTFLESLAGLELSWEHGTLPVPAETSVLNSTAIATDAIADFVATLASVELDWEHGSLAALDVDSEFDAA